jgi:hypothetical protein
MRYWIMAIVVGMAAWKALKYHNPPQHAVI